MPTYEYKCDACGHKFEKFQSMTADPVKVCPSCGKEAVQRLISGGAGLIFKGSGFYITDYRDAGYKDKAKADSAPGASGGESKSGSSDSGGSSSSSSSGGSESKPAASSGESKPAPKAETKSESKPAPKTE